MSRAGFTEYHVWLDIRVGLFSTGFTEYHVFIIGLVLLVVQMGLVEVEEGLVSLVHL